MANGMVKRQWFITSTINIINRSESLSNLLGWCQRNDKFFHPCLGNEVIVLFKKIIIIFALISIFY